jgi:hypothetical protein
MDSEDEEWLSKFNNEFQEHVSADNFELIIDAFEKVYYCNPDDSFDVKSAASCRQDLGSKEVVEAVYTYWMSKRKQKRSLLIRVFQVNLLSCFSYIVCVNHVRVCFMNTKLSFSSPNTLFLSCLSISVGHYYRTITGV